MRQEAVAEDDVKGMIGIGKIQDIPYLEIALSPVDIITDPLFADPGASQHGDPVSIPDQRARCLTMPTPHI
jgi:hypothetical protein